VAPTLGTITQNLAGNVSSVSFAHNHNIGSGGLLLVFVANGLNAVTVSSITYNGVAMTLVDSVVQNASRETMYRLPNPATGSNTLVVTMTATTGKRLLTQAVSFTGADATPRDTGTFGGVWNTSGSITINSSPNDLCIDGGSWDDASGSYTTGAGQTQRWNVNSSGRHWGSTEPGADPTVVMSGTCSIAIDVAHIATSVKSVSPGNQIIWMWSSRYQEFLKDLKRGLLAPNVLQERYGQLMASMPKAA